MTRSKYKSPILSYIDDLFELRDAVSIYQLATLFDSDYLTPKDTPPGIPKNSCPVIPKDSRLKVPKDSDLVLKDKTLAFRCYYSAARLHYAPAQYALARCYQFGSGTPCDPAKAVQYYRKAANQNHADAQYQLALCYYCGYCVDPDEIEADFLLRKAAEQGHAKAQQTLDKLYPSNPNDRP